MHHQIKTLSMSQLTPGTRQLQCPAILHLSSLVGSSFSFHYSCPAPRGQHITPCSLLSWKYLQFRVARNQCARRVLHPRLPDCTDYLFMRHNGHNYVIATSITVPSSLFKTLVSKALTRRGERRPTHLPLPPPSPHPPPRHSPPLLASPLCRPTTLPTAPQ